MEMQKPYDLKVLGDELKKEGIDEGVKVLKTGVTVLCSWLVSSMKLSSDGLVGKLDDLGIPLVGMFQKFALSKLDDLAASEAPVASAPAPEAPKAE
jgi:hypothetical protein